jgi:hypothetical protein
MANLSNINNKLLVGTNGEVRIGDTATVADVKLRVKQLDNQWPMQIVSNYAYGLSIDTSLGTDGNAGSLQIYPNSGGGFIVRNDSRVGIGETSPSGALHVKSSTATTTGMVRLQNDMDNNYETLRVESLGNYDAHIGFLANGTSSYWWGIGIDYSDSGKFKISGDNILSVNPRLTIDTSGNVGIGVTDPQAKLEVKGASAGPADGNEIISVTNTTGNTKLLLGAVENFYGWIQSAEGSTYRNLLLNPLGGNVGIGVENPGAPLTVHGQQKWYTTNNDGNELRGFFNPGGSGDPAELSLYQANGTSVGVELRAFGNSYFNGGNVGIGTGTTSPSNSLHILGTSDQQLKIDVASGGTFSSINFAEAGSNKAAIAYKHSTNEIQLPYSGNASSFVTMMAGGSERIRITSDGRVEVTGSVLSIDTVDEYRQDFITTGASTPSFDIDLKNIGASGQPFEVFVAFTHYSTAYGAGLHQAYYQRSTVQSDITLIHTYFNQTSTNAGAWSVVWLSGTAIRVQKSAGTHLSQGYGYIRVTRLKP